MASVLLKCVDLGGPDRYEEFGITEWRAMYESSDPNQATYHN